MNITKFAIEKKRITSVLLFIVVIAGILTFMNMPRSEDPGFIIRTSMIQTIFPGASPERVEQLVTDKLEKVIQEMPELDFVNSISKPGVSIIYVNVKESYKDMRPIWDKLRRKTDKVKSSLPDGIRGPFINDEFGDVFGTVLAITGEGFSYSELKEIADEVRNELLLIPEAAKVDIYGAQEERIFVEYNNARLSELSISPYQLKQILEATNIIFPGGEIQTENEQIVLEPSGNFESVEELKRTVIKYPSQNELLYLQDIAHIYRGYIDPPTQKMIFNGESALGLGISLREGGNIINLGEAIKLKMNRFNEAYPIGVEFNFVAFQPFFVDQKVNDFTGNLMQAIGIVILVMLLTLGLRTGLVVASLIPMAMCMALFIMGFFDIGLDQLSLASLIIALGMLVDNAIVMSESIMVQMQEGKNVVEASIDSAKELRISLLTSSLTTAAAFLPIYLAQSNVGEYTAPLFKVVSITLLSSWILAITMTPLFCVFFLKVQKKKEEGYNSSFYKKYRSGLIAIIKKPIISIIATIIIFITVLQLFRFIPNIFFPKNDKPIMYITLEYPVGTPIIKTERAVAKLDEYLKSYKVNEADKEKNGITDWTAFIGQGAPRYVLGSNPEPPNPGYAYLIVNTNDREFIDDVLSPQIIDYCFKNFPDLSVDAQPLAQGPPVKYPVQVRISGKDIDEIYKISDEVRTKLNEFSTIRNVRDDWGPRSKKILVEINQPRAQRAGLSSQDIAISLQTILSGINTTEYREGDKVIPVTLRSEIADRQNISKLETFNIYIQRTGQSVPLKQVADLEIVWQPAKIYRRDRLKTVSINADLVKGGNAIAISSEMDLWLKEKSKEWKIGYKYELGGEVESSAKASASIGDQLPTAFLIIVLLLVFQFDSIRKPLIILCTIPLGMIGVTIGLFVTSTPFGFMALLGVISLAGIVINNAIVLIDRIQLEIDEHGLTPQKAIIESAQRRLRPILLTTCTTAGGLLPLWFFGGAMFESMAVAILFGLLFATGLTLGVVPVLYSLFYKIKFNDFKY